MSLRTRLRDWLNAPTPAEVAELERMTARGIGAYLASERAASEISNPQFDAARIDESVGYTGAKP